MSKSSGPNVRPDGYPCPPIESTDHSSWTGSLSAYYQALGAYGITPEDITGGLYPAKYRDILAFEVKEMSKSSGPNVCPDGIRIRPVEYEDAAAWEGSYTALDDALTAGGIDSGDIEAGIYPVRMRDILAFRE